MALRILPVNAFDTASIAIYRTSDGAAHELATFPVANLQSNVRDRVWRSPSTVEQVILGSWSGNAKQISSWGMFPAIGAASLLGMKIRVQIYSDAAFSTQVYDSGTLDAFTWTGQGWGTFLWGVQQWGVSNSDRTARLAPIIKYFTAVVAGSFAITLSDSGAVDTNYFEASRFWFADYVDGPYNALLGAAPQWRSGSQHQRSIGGSLRRLPRTRWRELRFQTVFASESDRSAWTDLMYVCDPANEIVISLFPGDAVEKKERDFTVMGSLEVLNPIVFENVDFHTLQLAIVES